MLFEPHPAQHWLETFFGQAGKEYHVVLAPAMFPTGGYGVTLIMPDGSKGIYEVARADRTSKTEPLFSRDLAALSIHEWGHAFVNPALAEHLALVKKLAPHFLSVREQMKKQAYGTLTIYANEQVLRACEVLAARDLHGAAKADRLIQYENRRGFLLTAAAVRSLEKYAANRDRYPNFAAYVPTLLADLASEPVADPNPAPARIAQQRSKSTGSPVHCLIWR